VSYLHSFFAVHEAAAGHISSSRGDADIGQLILFGFRHISFHTPDVCARLCMEFPFKAVSAMHPIKRCVERHQFPTNVCELGLRKARETSTPRGRRQLRRPLWL
jgi:hypothetical protein